MDTLSFDEVIALLKETPSMARTLRYITKRGCWLYPPFHGRPVDELLPHMRELQRACFNCGEDRPIYQGTCWGNMSCEIWVCSECAPEVQGKLIELREAAAQSSEEET